MTFTESVRTVLKEKYATFDGRAPRSEFWWFFLFSVIVQAVLNFLLGGPADEDAYIGLGGAIMGLTAFAISLALLIPTIAVGIRRLHDTDRSGWWILIALIPLIGGIVLLVFYALQGTPGANRFGPDPLAGDGAHPPE